MDKNIIPRYNRSHGGLMITYTGFVCFLELDGRGVLFGTSPRTDSAFERFGLSNLSPFPDEATARLAVASVVERARTQGNSPDFRRISLTHAETVDELEAFRDQGDLVVIGYAGKGSDTLGPYSGLYGALVRGKPTALPLPCAFFAENGLAPFATFKETEEAACEIARQAQQKVTIGRLVFR